MSNIETNLNKKRNGMDAINGFINEVNQNGDYIKSFHSEKREEMCYMKKTCHTTCPYTSPHLCTKRKQWHNMNWQHSVTCKHSVTYMPYLR